MSSNPISPSSDSSTSSLYPAESPSSERSSLSPSFISSSSGAFLLATGFLKSLQQHYEEGTLEKFIYGSQLRSPIRNFMDCFQASTAMGEIGLKIQQSLVKTAIVHHDEPALLFLLKTSGIKIAPDNDSMYLAISNGFTKGVAPLIYADSGLESVNKDGYTPLMWAIVSRQLAAFNELIGLGAHPKREVFLDGQKSTLAHLAVRHKLPQVLQDLQKAGLNIDRKNSVDQTPLMEALLLGDVSAIEELLHLGADPKQEILLDGQKSTLAHLAVRQKFPQALQHLQTAGLDIGSIDESRHIPLIEALLGKDIVMTKELLRLGANPKEEISLEGKKSTLAHLAVKLKLPQVLQDLQDAGLGIDAIDERGHTPLIEALRMGSISAVKELLRLRADPKRQIPVRGHKSTLAHLVVKQKFPQALKYLQAAGLDIDSVDDQGYPPFQRALAIGDISAAKELLRLGADPKREVLLDGKKTTLVHLVVNQKVPQALECLQAAGLDIDSEDESGCTPLTKALLLKDISAVKELLRLGADPKRQLLLDGRKTTLAHLALKENFPEVLPDLKAAGLDIDAIDERGYTPLLKALFVGDIVTAQALIDLGADWNRPQGPNQIPIIHMLAQASETDQSIEFLKDLGAPIDDPLGGMTPLMKAIAARQLAAAEKLIELGADCTRNTPEGKTLLSLSVDHQFGEILPCLRAKLSYLFKPMNINRKFLWVVAANRGYSEMLDDLRPANYPVSLTWMFQEKPTLSFSPMTNEEYQKLTHEVFERILKLLTELPPEQLSKTFPVYVGDPADITMTRVIRADIPFGKLKEVFEGLFRQFQEKRFELGTFTQGEVDAQHAFYSEMLISLKEIISSSDFQTNAASALSILVHIATPRIEGRCIGIVKNDIAFQYQLHVKPDLQMQPEIEEFAEKAFYEHLRGTAQLIARRHTTVQGADIHNENQLLYALQFMQTPDPIPEPLFKESAHKLIAQEYATAEPLVEFIRKSIIDQGQSSQLFDWLIGQVDPTIFQNERFIKALKNIQDYEQREHNKLLEWLQTVCSGYPLSNEKKPLAVEFLSQFFYKSTFFVPPLPEAIKASPLARDEKSYQLANPTEVKNYFQLAYRDSPQATNFYKRVVAYQDLKLAFQKQFGQDLSHSQLLGLLRLKELFDKVRREYATKIGLPYVPREGISLAQSYKDICSREYVENTFLDADSNPKKETVGFLLEEMGILLE